MSFSASPSEPTMNNRYGGFLQEIQAMSNSFEKLTSLDSLLKRLEEERRKIDAFKRELPLSMLLLNDAIESLNEEFKQCRMNAPVLEEFMPIKKNSNEGKDNLGFVAERDCNKMNWMSSAQLWSNHKKSNLDDLKEIQAGSDRLQMGSLNSKQFSIYKHRNGGTRGAFLPFKSNRREEKAGGLADLSLAPGMKSLSSNCSTGLTLKLKNPPPAAANARDDSQTQRKARRCWSPELHRRFINALQQLGGSQVATPKLIREMMKVDGLTNDEVKSHLQKYRLHTRRSNLAAPGDGGFSRNGGDQKTNQAALLGEIWGSNEYSTQEAQSYKVPSKHIPAHSGSPQGPLQFAGNGRGISANADSGEDDDGKSDSYTSWKAHIQRSGEVTD